VRSNTVSDYGDAVSFRLGPFERVLLGTRHFAWGTWHSDSPLPHVRKVLESVNSPRTCDIESKPTSFKTMSLQNYGMTMLDFFSGDEGGASGVCKNAIRSCDKICVIIFVSSASRLPLVLSSSTVKRSIMCCASGL